MKMSKGRKAIEETALKYHVSVDEVRRDLEEAIDEGMKSTEPEAIAFWDKLSKNRTARPSPEEFILAAAKRVDGQRKPQGIKWFH